jgi:outer membrane lipoprotein carrier protein
MMKRTLKALLVSLAVAVFGFLRLPVHAEVDLESLEATLKRLEDRYRSVKTIQGDFLQITERVSQARRTFKERGRFFFYLPGKMRWEYATQPKKLILSDGKTLWMLEPTPERPQVIKAPLVEETLYKTPLALLLGAGNLRNSFEVISLEEGQGEIKLGLAPKRAMDLPLKRLTLYLSQEGTTIQGIVMMDYFGNQTALRFSNLKWNARLPDALFRFDPPKGAQIIEH